MTSRRRSTCQERSAEFCAQSASSRQLLVDNLKEQMLTILGFADGPVFGRNTDVDGCFVDYCGSCNGAGTCRCFCNLIM